MPAAMEGRGRVRIERTSRVINNRRDGVKTFSRSLFSKTAFGKRSRRNPAATAYAEKPACAHCARTDRPPRQQLDAQNNFYLKIFETEYRITILCRITLLNHTVSL